MMRIPRVLLRGAASEDSNSRARSLAMGWSSSSPVLRYWRSSLRLSVPRALIGVLVLVGSSSQDLGF